MSHDASPDELVPLGRAPRPTTDADLTARILQALRDEAGDRLTAPERVRVAAALDGADVASLAVDLSGVVARVRVGSPQAPHAPWRPAERRSTEPGTVRTLRVDAHPVVVEDVPVDVTAVAEGLRLDWVETHDDRLGIAPVEPDEAHPVSGHVRVAVPQDAVVATARRLLTDELSARGLALSSLDVEITSSGPRAVAVRAFARVRKGLLSASVQAVLAADVDDRSVLTVRELDLSSRNPAVAALLVVARRHVEELRGRTFDLAAELPAGVRLGDLRLDVDASRTVALTARFV
ncbi:hypothetical protein [Cellulosimicrobium cellulans]|uniref:hypothetical protein n=1 Tax=Cellulosimicrobium cellulans TaxID=1710 RepID=UPI0008487DDA|nr:hypothetical protein [Cellulosimicrobium cellulans]